MICKVCGSELTRKRKRKETEYVHCGKRECRREMDRRRTRDYVYNQKNNPPSPERQANIDRMKREISTKEEYILATKGRDGQNRIAGKYGINTWDVSEWMHELFKGMTEKEKRKLRKKVYTGSKKEVTFERKPRLVNVYKVVDREAFERGGVGTYDGLELARTEYADEVRFNFGEGI